MANQQSFDITSGCDLQEVDNAVNQASKEISQRFDFKNVVAKIDFARAEGKLVLSGPNEQKLAAMSELLMLKLAKRGVPLKNLKVGEIKPATGASVRQEIELAQGISKEAARAITAFLKERKLKKVQAAIQDEQIRISSPSRDELQSVMALLKQQDFGVELKFGNFRSG